NTDIFDGVFGGFSCISFTSFTCAPDTQPVFPLAVILYQPLDSAKALYLLPFFTWVSLALFVVGFALIFSTSATTSSLSIFGGFSCISFTSFICAPNTQPVFPLAVILYQPLDSAKALYLLPFFTWVSLALFVVGFA